MRQVLTLRDELSAQGRFQNTHLITLLSLFIFAITFGLPYGGRTSLNILFNLPNQKMAVQVPISLTKELLKELLSIDFS